MLYLEFRLLVRNLAVRRVVTPAVRLSVGVCGVLFWGWNACAFVDVVEGVETASQQWGAGLQYKLLQPFPRLDWDFCPLSIPYPWMDGPEAAHSDSVSRCMRFLACSFYLSRFPERCAVLWLSLLPPRLFVLLGGGCFQKTWILFHSALATAAQQLAPGNRDLGFCRWLL